MGAVMDSKSDDPSLDRDTFYKQRRGRNLAILAAIVACCVLFYVITIARML